MKLAMHVTAMLVLLHGPKEQRPPAALGFPSFLDVLLLLLVLDKMLAFVFREQDAPIVQLREEIGVERAGGLCEKSGSLRAGSAVSAASGSCRSAPPAMSGVRSA